MSDQPQVILDRVHTRMVDEIAVHDYGMTGLVLMENAGRGCAHHLLTLGIDGPVTICCGPGNNGGDGLVMARHLVNAGASVRVLLSSMPTAMSPEARANYDILAKTSTAIDCVASESERGLPSRLGEALKNPEAWIVDALLGTGARGLVRAPYDTWIEQINDSPGKKLAVDLPSGLDCDSGQPNGCCVQASETCTFVALKPCFLLEPGKRLAGKVTIIDIGVPKEIRIAVEERQKRRGEIDFGRP